MRKKAAFAILCLMLLLVPVGMIVACLDTDDSPPITFPSFVGEGGERYYGNTTGYEVINTTNPDAAVSGGVGILSEEGSIPVNVIVVADEEARHNMLWNDFFGGAYEIGWYDYAERQIERGDESLIAKYDIDLRVQEILCGYSDDSLDNLFDVLIDLEENLGWRKCGFKYDGVQMDVLVCITGQCDEYAGIARPHRNSLIVAAHSHCYQAYWADDNLIQHEFSHLLFCDDHLTSADPSYDADCIMSYKSAYLTYVSEDGVWIVFSNVPKVYRTHSYCDTCDDHMETNKNKYPMSKSDPATGCEIIPINMMQLMAPYITLVSAVTVATISVASYRKFRRARN